MKRFMLWLSVVYGLSSASALTAQESYPDFALVVQLPSYETFMTNLGDSPIRVDGYQITSASASLNPSGLARLGASGPEGVAALGPGVSQFFAANPSKNSLSELNPISSATWQPGQSWSIGFPFDSGASGFVRDAVFRFSSADGLVLTGGTVVPPGVLALATFLVIPEHAGDFNGDDVVDAADYVVWRKGLGTTYSAMDYAVWREHFGQSGGSSPGRAFSAAIPEPTTTMFLWFATMLGIATRRAGFDARNL